MPGVLTVMGRELSDANLETLSQSLRNFASEPIASRRLTNCPTSLAHEAVEFTLETRLDPGALSALKAIGNLNEIDIIFQDESWPLETIRLAVFDMDSTLLECEVIDELAKLAGVGDRVAQITERAMRGELDFAQSFRERLSMLAGLPVEQAERLADRLPISAGARALVQTLRQHGCHTAICSGGFELYALRLQSELGIDSIYANQLEVREGKLTGHVEGEIVDGERKAARLVSLANESGVGLEAAMAVGDGANDLPMIGLAGLGIAYHAKPHVREQAPVSIDHVGLDSILHLMGFHESAFVR